MMLAEPFVDQYADWFAFAALVLAVLTIILAVVIYRLQARPVRLDYSIVELAPILNASVADSDIQVTYKGDVVDEPYVVVLRLTNSGKTDFESSAFHQPVKFDFGEARWLSRAIESGTDDLRVTEIGSAPTLTSYSFKPDLMNASEWLELRFVLDRMPIISVSTRVTGLSGIREVSGIQKVTFRDFLESDSFQDALRRSGVPFIGLLVAAGLAVAGAISA